MSVREGCFQKLGVKVLCSFGMMCSIAACTVSSNGGGDGVSAVGLSPREWAALSRPSPSHKLLAPLTGTWSVKNTFWSAPKAKGESSLGTSKITWILGSRFIQEHFSSDIGGGDYSGIGIMGYDNGSRTFKSVWLDSLNTAMTTATGRYNPDIHAIEFESQVYDPLRSGTKTVSSVLQFLSADSYTFTMTDISPEGERFTSLLMEYTRTE